MSGCIFCKIASGEIKSSLIHDDPDVAAFYDIAPQAPSHIVVVPKQHIDRLENVKDGEIFRKIFSAISVIITKLGLDKDGYRVVVNSGRDGGQTVEHLHFHILGGRPMKWPPG